jgi:hypothetical protein
MYFTVVVAVQEPRAVTAKDDNVSHERDILFS